jgi:hypothetical protein
VVHAYTAANELWDLRQGLDTKCEAYKRLQEERLGCLWLALQRMHFILVLWLNENWVWIGFLSGFPPQMHLCSSRLFLFENQRLA